MVRQQQGQGGQAAEQQRAWLERCRPSCGDRPDTRLHPRLRCSCGAALPPCSPAMTSRLVELARTENLSNFPKAEAACSREGG